MINYSVEYPLGVALQNSTDLVAIIRDSVFEDLKTESIGGYDIDADYIDEVAKGELNQSIYSKCSCDKLQMHTFAQYTHFSSITKVPHIYMAQRMDF